jgi:hypothetical protein
MMVKSVSAVFDTSIYKVLVNAILAAKGEKIPLA